MWMNDLVSIHIQVSKQNNDNFTCWSASWHSSPALVGSWLCSYPLIFNGIGNLFKAKNNNDNFNHHLNLLGMTLVMPLTIQPKWNHSLW